MNLIIVIILLYCCDTFHSMYYCSHLIHNLLVKKFRQIYKNTFDFIFMQLYNKY